MSFELSGEYDEFSIVIDAAMLMARTASTDIFKCGLVMNLKCVGSHIFSFVTTIRRTPPEQQIYTTR